MHRFCCVGDRPVDLFGVVTWTVLLGERVMKKTLMIAGSMIAASLLVSASTGTAGTSAGMGGGGRFDRYDPIIAQYNASGEEFRITGHCQSACTLLLGIRNVCVERSANLLFHAAHLIADPNKTPVDSLTNHLRAMYTPALTTYLDGHGYLSRPQFHAISGAQLARFGYRICTDKK